MKNQLQYFILLVFLSACGIQQYSSPTTLGKPSGRQDDLIPPNAQPGKCYQKSFMPDVYDTRMASYPVYTGMEKDVPVEYKEMMVIPPKTEWKRNNSGELCLVETPAVTQKIAVLNDTIRHKDFQVQMVEYKVLTQKRGYNDFVEVVCGERVSRKLIQDVSSALMSKGYISTTSSQWSPELKNALKSFQNNNALPVGGLDYETLAALGVKAP